MLQLQILSGKQAGHLWEARRFPARVGRAAGNDLRLEEAGVWDEHFQLTADAAIGFTLVAHPGALVTINQSPTPTVRLKSGDIITAGAVKISFRLSETHQCGLRLREALVWLLIVGVSLGQLVLIGWMLN